QIWIALSIYLLVVIAKKKLNIPCQLYTFLQILEVNLFEKKPLPSMIADALKQISEPPRDNQLNLFNC
ncbi:MAG: IS4 family transposase, partial [Chloroflexi bacterium]